MICVTGCAAAPSGLSPAPVPSDSGLAGGYRVWVTSESVDEVTLLRFDGDSLRVEEKLRVGAMPLEIDGPHGVAVSPDGRFIFVSLGHGTPFGSLWKIDARSHEVVGRINLGYFPATVSVTPNGEFAFVSNFNLHGDHVPSSISRVHTESMSELGRIETCVMPHGSRVNPLGTSHYSVCMMDEQLIEIDVESGEVVRRFSVARDAEGPLSGQDGGHQHTPPGEVVAGSAGSAGAMTMPTPGCSPTWAEPSADGAHVYVTCNRAREVLEIDVERWTLRRRFDTGDAPYNLATTPDGRYLLVSLRSRTEPALEMHDLSTGQLLARLPTSTTLAHGIAVSSDSRYAFVSVEGVGSEPGRVDVFDLTGRRRVASAAVGQQATGIAIAP